MELYNYDDSGIYIKTTKARPDPMEFGLWLIPRNATVIKPPETGENEVAVFGGAEWSIVADYRGVPYWILPDREERYQHELGELPEGAVLELPPYTSDELTEMQAEIDRINGILEAQESAGLKNISIAQAESYIDGQLDPLTIPTDAKNALKNIFKKMIPYLLK